MVDSLTHAAEEHAAKRQRLESALLRMLRVQ